MDTEPQESASWRFAPRLSSLLTVGWVAILAFFFLFRYNGWLIPVQMAALFRETLPALAIGPHFAEFWQARLADGGCVAAILVTAFAVGAVAIDRLTPEKNLLTALFSLAVGLWILCVSILLVGAASVSALPWVFLLAGCWLLPAPRKFFHRPTIASERLDGWAKLMLACVIAAALLNLLSAMTPPFEYDALEYHLGAPAEYIKAGRIIALPHNFYSNMPQLTEMLYLLALKMSSGVAAKLLHWAFGVLSAVAVYAVTARLWKKQIGLTAAALFYCIPLMQDLSETARIDLATTFFAVLAFGCLLVWQQERRPAVERCAGSGLRRAEAASSAQAGDPRTTLTAFHRSATTTGFWFCAAALAAGTAVATKWTAVAVVVLPALIFLVVATKSFRLPSVFCLLSSVFVVPWLLKNWLFMGNPVYPLFYGVFQSQHWGAEQAALFAQKHYASFGWDGWAQSVGLIWQYSFKEPFAVPLLLMTAPLILLLRNVTSSARRTGWLFVAAYAGWFLLTFRPWRFLFPTFPLAAMTGAYALHVAARGRFVRMIVRTAVTVVVAVGLAEEASVTLVDQQDYKQLPPQMDFVQYALGQVSREEFVERMGGGMFEPILWMNRHLPLTAKVLYVGEARVYYARNPVIWSTAFDQHALSEMSREAATAAQWYNLLRQHGIAYIYINSVELARLSKSYGFLRDVNWRTFYEMLRKHAELVHETDRTAVYQLKNPT
jgi:4-amino-4-deoxy-L-arabinose transferase-like glycosyltransferase